MNNAELRGMLNELARLIVLSRAIPAQLLSKAQRLYHALEMEATELPQKKYARCAQGNYPFVSGEFMPVESYANVSSEGERGLVEAGMKLTED